MVKPAQRTATEYVGMVVMIALIIAGIAATNIFGTIANALGDRDQTQHLGLVAGLREGLK